MQFKDFLGNECETECLGCDIGGGKIIPPGGLIYESSSFVLHQDPEIPIRGFLIIATKAHVSSISQLSANQRYEMTDIMNMGISALKDLDITNEVTIIQEEKSSHLHLWLYPWHTWMDDKFNKSISSLRDINKYTKENISDNEKDEIVHTVKRIRQRLNTI